MKINYRILFLILNILTIFKVTNGQLVCECACNQSLSGITSLTYICNMKLLMNQTLVKFNKITELFLAKNQIESIESKAFSTLTKLDFLDLSRNNLQALNNETFMSKFVDNNIFS